MCIGETTILWYLGLTVGRFFIKMTCLPLFTSFCNVNSFSILNILQSLLPIIGVSSFRPSIFNVVMSYPPMDTSATFNQEHLEQYMVNFNPMDWGNFVRWQSYLENTKESVLLVLHFLNFYLQIILKHWFFTHIILKDCLKTLIVLSKSISQGEGATYCIWICAVHEEKTVYEKMAKNSNILVISWGLSEGKYDVAQSFINTRLKVRLWIFWSFLEHLKVLLTIGVELKKIRPLF